MVQGPQQSLILERGGRSFRQMIDRVPKQVDFIVSEGGDAQAAATVIVCLADRADWEETLQVRSVPRDKILAVAGSFVSVAGTLETFGGIAVFDSTRVEDRQALVQRILKAEGRRRASTAGPRRS
jgi:Cys-tRNA synthase (O-phospho-L-seryl-tRNA:Cys-tRNA synthase)